MALDFNRVPPRVEVPAAPRVSIPFWALLFLLITASAAGLTIKFWPAGSTTNSLRFWFYAFIGPILASAFLLFAWLSYGYLRLGQALMDNRVRDDVEQASHMQASLPLTITGVAWCVSSDDTENSLEHIRTGATELTPVPSGADADTYVVARWFTIPGMPFSPGNALDEYVRHRVLCNWLFERLIDRISPHLSALPARAKIRVELQHRSWLETDVVSTMLLNRLAARIPELKIDSIGDDQTVPLFRSDSWFDEQSVNTVRLVVAIELRKAISTVLSDGMAEAGVALLITHPALMSPSEPTGLSLHRPAKSTLDTADTSIKLAIRWGQTTLDRVRMVWTNGLAFERMNCISRSVSFPDQAKSLSLETSIGDCGGAGDWLAVSLAAATGEASGDAQLVLCGDDEELVALVCEGQT